MVNGTHVSDFRVKEPKLGETFLYKGVKLKTVKGFCPECYFSLMKVNAINTHVMAMTGKTERMSGL